MFKHFMTRLKILQMFFQIRHKVVLGASNPSQFVGVANLFQALELYLTHTGEMVTLYNKVHKVCLTTQEQSRNMSGANG